MSKHKRLALGLLLSSGISLLAYQRRSLSKSGVTGAITTGTVTFGLGGLAWGLSLIHFLVSSSLFSRYREHDKAQTAIDKFSKGGQRDIAQVAANGGMATLLAIGHSLTPSSALRETLQAGYVGALATATADTWATELGVLSATAPRLITTGKATHPGTSGGITSLCSQKLITIGSGGRACGTSPQAGYKSFISYATSYISVHPNVVVRL
jgi:uncharacterized protein (TIGR00297 family)